MSIFQSSEDESKKDLKEMIKSPRKGDKSPRNDPHIELENKKENHENEKPKVENPTIQILETEPSLVERPKIDLKALKSFKETKDISYISTGVESEKEGWVECEQENSGKKYYYNMQTKRTTWKKPIDGEVLMVSPRLLKEQTKTPRGNEERKRGEIHSDDLTGSSNHGTLLKDIKEHESNPIIKKLPLNVDDLTRPRRNSDSVFSEAKVATFYNLKGDPIQFSSNVSEILKSVDLTFKTDLSMSSNHNLVTYAKENFQKHKVKVFLFSRELKPEELIQWNKIPLEKSLHNITNPKEVETAKECYKIIHGLITSQKTTLDYKQVHTLIELSLAQVNVRNEVLVYAIRECNNNPNIKEEVKAIQLLMLLLTAYPPTKQTLQDSIIQFLFNLQKKYQGKELEPYIVACQQRLRRTLIVGPRKTPPKEKYIEIYSQPKDPLPLFGVSIEEYFSWQSKAFPDSSSPYILYIISERLKEINGFITEGLFRLPGDFEQLEMLKDNFGQGDFKIDCKDPHVLASLFKLWLRELSEPLIPKSKYDLCLQNADNMDEAINIIMNLPKLNSSVIVFVCSFIAENILQENVISKTKMDVENIAVVFTPNFLRNSDISDPKDIMKNAPLEKKFVKNLIQSARKPKK